MSLHINHMSYDLTFNEKGKLWTREQMMLKIVEMFKGKKRYITAVYLTMTQKRLYQVKDKLKFTFHCLSSFKIISTSLKLAPWTPHSTTKTHSDSREHKTFLLCESQKKYSKRGRERGKNVTCVYAIKGHDALRYGTFSLWSTLLAWDPDH